MDELLKKDIVVKQLELLRFRNTCKAFSFDADICVTCEGEKMTFTWKYDGVQAVLEANLKTFDYAYYACETE